MTALVRWIVAALVVAIAFPGAALSSHQRTADDPDTTIRAFITAVYGRDVEAYRRLTMPDARRDVLILGARINTAKLEQLKRDPASLQMRRNRPFFFRGREVTPTGGRYPTGTTALYTVAHGGGPTMVSLVRQDDDWKVDVRWWLAQADLESAPPKQGTAEHAARVLASALLAMDRSAAARFAVGGNAALELLFLGASREPSGHLDALAQEMPVVELRPGEFYPIGDRVVEGSKDPNLKVLLGLFGSIEIPFVARRTGSDWRIEPQPFFGYFNR